MFSKIQRESVNKAMSNIALALAIPSTILFGPLALLETFFGASSFFYEKYSWDAAFGIFVGVFGLIGIIGLWMRYFIPPSALESFSVNELITAMLFAGTLSALSFGSTIVYLIFDPNEQGSAGASIYVAIVIFMVLGLIGLVLTAHNFIATKMFKREVGRNG